MNNRDKHNNKAIYFTLYQWEKTVVVDVVLLLLFRFYIKHIKQY